MNPGARVCRCPACCSCDNDDRKRGFNRIWNDAVPEAGAPMRFRQFPFRSAAEFITLPPMARPRKTGPKPAQSYRHPEADLPARPEIGAQAHFKKAKPPATYRFDSSLAPELQWDGQNPARETAEALIKEIADCGLRIADLASQPAGSKRDQEIANRKSQIANLQSRLRRISGPFLN